MNAPFGPSGYSYASYGYGSQPSRGYGPPYPGPVPASAAFSNNVSASTAYDPLALQMRLVRAKQINVICKQAVIRNHLINHCGTINNALPPSMPSSVDQQQATVDREEYLVKQLQKHPMSYNEQRKPYSEHTEKLHPALDSPADLQSRRKSTFSSAPPTNGVAPTTLPGPRSTTASHDEHDNYDVIAEQPVQPPVRRGDREDAKLLNTLSESLATTVANSATVLKKLNAKKNRVSPAERAKKKLEQMIKINAKTPAVMPLWRHRLNGRNDPPPETVLRGKRLFRLIAKAVMYMFIKPTVAVIRRKLNAREGHRKDLQKTLRLLAGAFDDWLGKIVQLPVTSIIQDSTLQFDPAESMGINSQPLKTRMLQLKVRLRAVVLNIAKAEMPSAFLTDSLVALAEDGNYFAPEVLWDCEVQQLEFNSLGGTRNMVPPADSPVPSDGLAGSINSGRAVTSASGRAAPTNAVTLSVADGVNIGGAGGDITETVCANRVRLLLQNFLLLRTLVAHLLLAPWHCALCAPPSARAARRVLYNHRMLATVVYELLRRLDSSLPVLPETSNGKFASSQIRATERFILPSRPADAPYVLGDAMVAEARRVQQAVPPPAATQAPAAPAAGAGAAGRSRKLSAAAMAADGTALTTAASSANEAAVSAAESSLLYQLAKLMGVRDTPPGEEAAPTQGSVESALLEQRFDFPSQAQLLSLLLPASQLAPVRVYLDEWFAELRGPLDAWLQRVAVHVLTRRLALRLEREARENA